MANAKELKDRIRSVGDTRKITNAMYLIASMKMRKAKAELDGTRPYFEAIRGETRAFDRRIQEARPYEGQITAAANVMRLVEGSTRVSEDARKVHLEHDVLHPVYQERVQDNYCFRCMPQVQGVCRENLSYVKHLVEVEINAATDNPLIFPKGDGHYEFLSGGNFHGEPTGFAMDILTMSLVEIGNVADRRCFTLCDPTISYGLPLALAGEPAITSSAARPPRWPPKTRRWPSRRCATTFPPRPIRRITFPWRPGLRARRSWSSGIWRRSSASSCCSPPAAFISRRRSLAGSSSARERPSPIRW